MEIMGWVSMARVVDRVAELLEQRAELQRDATAARIAAIDAQLAEIKAAEAAEVDAARVARLDAARERLAAVELEIIPAFLELERLLGELTDAELAVRDNLDPNRAESAVSERIPAFLRQSVYRARRWWENWNPAFLGLPERPSRVELDPVDAARAHLARCDAQLRELGAAGHARDDSGAFRHWTLARESAARRLEELTGEPVPPYGGSGAAAAWMGRLLGNG